jgi:hypothetical protein
MDNNWQTLVVLAVVGVAMWHLVRRAQAVLRSPGNSSCGSCTSCPPPDEKRLPLVELRDAGKE